MYADLDVECLQPTETLIEKYGQPGKQAFLGRMGTDESSISSLPNAWFASTPGHPFWVLPLEYVQNNYHTIDGAEGLSGPGALYNVVNDYNEHYTHGELDRHYAQSGWRHVFPKDARDLSGSNEESTNQTVTILPFWEIYPYSWERDGHSYREYCWTRMEKFNETMCKLLLGTDHWESHTITYWSHSWGEDGDDGHDEAGLKSISGEMKDR